MASEISISDLIESLSYWEIAGYISAAAVVAGCSGEAVHEFTRWWRGCVWWRKNGGRGSSLLLIAALAVEIPIQLTTNRKSGQIIAILSNQAAETRLRAAEIERKYAWRVINGSQRTKLLAALSGQNFGLILEYSRNDPEAWEFAIRLFNVLSESTLKVTPYDIVPFQPGRGLRLNGPAGANRDAIGAALKGADLKFSVGDEPTIGTEERGAVRISVGSKDPPS